MKKLILILLIISFLLILLILNTGCILFDASSPGKDEENNYSIWTTQLLGFPGESTYANGITSDINGNVYATGYTTGNLDGQTLTGLSDLFIVKYNSSGYKLWTKLLGVSGKGTSANSITSDTSGNVYITGYTTGNLDGQTLSGSKDLFIVKYNSNGDKQWTRLLGVPGFLLINTNAYGITSDANGNVYATGETNGNLDGQTLTGFSDLFIVKYNSSGYKLWTKLLGVSGKGTSAYCITSDRGGNIYAAGYTAGNLDGQTSTGGADLFIVKYNSNGEKQWTKLLGTTTGYTYAYGITSDIGRNIYTTGYTEGNLDGQTLTGTKDLFVVKYNSNGNKQWTRLLGVSGVETRANSIASDTGGNLYVTGYTSGNLDGQILTGTHDLFIVKYNSNGEKQWTRLLGASGEGIGASGIISNISGNLYVTGSTTGNLDGQTLTGKSDLFIIKYDSNGIKQ